jgi:adenine deaminase
METCSVHSVLKAGKWASELDRPKAVRIAIENSIRASIPEVSDLNAPEGKVHVIGIQEGKIITDHRIRKSSDRGVAKISVLERYGKGSKPANGYVEGFGENFQGAIASSVGHDSHNLIAVGSNAADIRAAMAALAQSGGGFCVVRDGAVLEQIDLPLGGLMSDRSSPELKTSLEKMKGASKSVGCELQEPFLQLAFLSLPVIPSLKLTDQGLVDVNQFKIIDVRAV